MSLALPDGRTCRLVAGGSDQVQVSGRKPSTWPHPEAPAHGARTDRSGPYRIITQKLLSTTVLDEKTAQFMLASRDASDLAPGPGQVPTRKGACSLRSAASADRAVIRPVFGFSEGMFSMVNENRAESASTSMVWQLRSTVGSAQISMVVRSGPMPASDSAAATFTLAGNPAPPRAHCRRTPAWGR